MPQIPSALLVHARARSLNTHHHHHYHSRLHRQSLLDHVASPRAAALNDVSEIANPSCLLELKAAVDEWRVVQAMPTLDERC